MREFLEMSCSGILPMKIQILRFEWGILEIGV